MTFGPSFGPAASATQIMLLSVPSIVLVNAWLPFLYQRRQEGRVARVTTAIMVMGSGSIMLMTALLGTTGAAVAYASRAFVVAVVLGFMVMRADTGSHVHDTTVESRESLPSE
jgi:O-antigen/teichoic acid export membrane protein